MMPSTPFFVKRMEQDARIAQAGEREQLREAYQRRNSERPARSRSGTVSLLALVSVMFMRVIDYMRS
jgi:hypothetical protein